MKQFKNFLTIAIIAFAYLTKAQTPGTSCATSYSLPSTSVLGIKQTNNQGWCSFTTIPGITFITVQNTSYAPSRKIKKVIVQNGTCSSLNIVAQDSLSSPSDSTLKVIMYDPLGGNTFYVTTMRQDSLDCPSCSNDTAIFNLLRAPGTGPCQTLANCFTSTACEYICNGSFETQTTPPGSISLLGVANGWFSASAATPDAFSGAAGTAIDVQVPCNLFGSQNALNFGSPGNGYAGIYTSSGGTSGYYAEYIETTLTSPLTFTLGLSFYEVSFWVSRGDFAQYDNANVSVFLTSGSTCSTIALQPISTWATPIPPVYTETNTVILNDYNNWKEIKFIYCTYGGEDHLMIGSYDGNIGPNTGTVTSVGTCSLSSFPNNTLLLPGGYLYIDDVRIKDLNSFSLTSTNNVCPNVPINFSVTTGCSFTTSPTYFNWAFGDGSTLSAASGTVSHPYTAPGIYIATVTINAPTSIGSGTACGTFMLTQTITILPTPTVIASASPNNVCPGGSSTLTASGALSYTWSTGGFTAAITVTPAVTTTYTVTGINAAGCTNTAVVTVTVNPPPTVSITATPPSICSGASSTLTQTPLTTFTWFPSGPVVTPSVTTTYTVSGTTAAGCFGTGTITIVVNPNPTITIVKSAGTICQGASVTMTLSGAVSFTTIPVGLPGSPITVTPSVTTTYTVIGTNAFGCVGSQVTTIVVLSNTTIVTAFSSTNICSTASVTLHSSPMMSYTWTGNSIISGINFQNATVSPSVTSTYTVSGFVGGVLNCPRSGTITIAVIPTPTIIPIASPSVICSGQVVSLTASGAFNYTWNPGGLTGSAVSVTPATSTTYTVVGKIGPCSDTKTINILVTPSPTLIASASPTNICSGSSTTLTASGASSFTWNPGGLIGSSVVVSPTVNTTYAVTAANGSCTASQNVFISVIPTPTSININSGTGNFHICKGNSTTLSTNITNPSMYNFFWSPTGQTTPVITITPTDNAVYSVFVSDNVGCGSSLTSSTCVDVVSSLCCTTSTNVLTNYTITGAPYNGVGLVPPTVLEIYGQLTIAVNTNWANVTAKIHGSQKIIVLPGVVFSLDHVRFFSCDDIWKGIELQHNAVASSTIIASKSIFEDAYQAIQYDPMGGTFNSNIRIKDCLFNKNYIGVEIDNIGVGGVISGDLNATTTSTYITQTSTTSPGPSLKCSSYYTPIIRTRGAIGWKLDKVDVGLTIGTTTASLGSGNYLNFFENLDNGIYMNESGLNVCNARFRNMDGVNRPSLINPYSNVGAAIYAIATVSTTGTNPSRKLFNNNDLCQNVWRGVATYGMTDVETISSAFTGTTTSSSLCTAGCIGNAAVFYNDAHLSTKASTLNINNFAMGVANYFSTTSAGSGFLAAVGQNTITSNANGFLNIGVHLMDASNNFTAVVGNPLSIANNTITNATNGIWIENIKSGARVSNNKLSVGSGSLSSSFVGILSNASNGAIIDNNRVVGTSTAVVNLRGINMNVSPLCEVACNTITSVYQALVYSGGNTSSTNGFHDNILGNAYDGLVLELNGIAGVQGSSVTASGNKWSGSFTHSQTFTDLSGGVGSSALNTPLWVNAGPPTQPTFNVSTPFGPAFGYNASGTLSFTPSGSAGCPTPLTSARVFTQTPPTQMQSAIDSDYNNLINASTNYTVFNIETHDWHNKHAYNAMKKGSITTSDPTLLTFYNAHKTACTGKFVDVDSLLENNQISSAIASNAAITATCSIDQNQKDVNDLLAKQLNNNLNAFTASEINTLWTIAKKCPYTDGNAVFQSRALLRIIHNDYIEFIDSCVTGTGDNGRFAKPTVNQNKIPDPENSFVLYPNPNNGSMNLMYQLKTVQNALLSIYDVAGKVIFKKELNHNSTRTEIDLKEIKEGMYYYKIEAENTTLKADKLIIIK